MDRGHALPHAAVVFACALAVRLFHVWQLRSSPFFDTLLGDAHGYDLWARRIAGGDWMGSEVFYQAPLYPYFLGTIFSIAGHNLLTVRVIQAVLGAGGAVLLALAVRRLVHPRAGLVAGLGLAFYAPAIFFDGLIQKPVLDVFLIALALWLIAILVDEPRRRGVWLSLGLTLGALSLTRENALVFVVVVLAWCLYMSKNTDVRLKPDATYVVAYLLGLALVLTPVAARNYAVGGGFYLTTSQFGPNFFIGNNPRADGTYMSLRFGRGAPEYERQDATELAQVALGRTLTPGEVSSYWTDRALAFIAGEPIAWLRLMGRKFLLLWNASEMLDTESQESYAEWSWPLRILGPLGHFGVLVPLAVIGAWTLWRDRRRLWVLYALTAAYAASVLLFYVFARYRQPLVPVLLLFASQGVLTLAAVTGIFRLQPDSTSEVRLKADTTYLPVRVLATLIVAVFANWPVLSAAEMRAITETNLGSALQEEGRAADAIQRFRRAIEIAPDYAPAHNNLGVVLRSQGAVREAIQSYERAIALNDAYPDAHYNLANALLADNRAADAQLHFEIALRTIPDSAGVRNNLGIALSAQGQKGSAVDAFRAAVAADPSSAMAHRNLAHALSDAGLPNEALKTMERAIELAPNDAGGHYDYGVMLLEANRPADAVRELRQAVTIDPAMVEAHNNLGVALGSTGDLRGAISAFERALALRPDFADAQRNLQMARSALR